MFSLDDLSDRELVYSGGALVGRVEAVGMARDGTLRRLGIRLCADAGQLRFVAVDRVRVDGPRLVLDRDPPSLI